MTSLNELILAVTSFSFGGVCTFLLIYFAYKNNS